jgi:hypothetical protein
MTALATRQEPRIAPLDEMRAFAEAAVKSRFYGFASVDQMLPLMMVAQSQGRSFVSVVEEYSVIQNRPALRAEAMLARFQKAGGHIKWTELSDTRCAAIFSHPQCDPVEIDWDMDRAKQAGLAGKDNYKKFPRNMLKARVISDGVRTAYPACLGGLYAVEEVQDFEPARTPPPTPARGQLAAPDEPGQVEAHREPTHSQHDGEEMDQTTQPEWPIMLEEMEAYSTREDLKAWWTTPEKKALKSKKPHLMRAFYRFAYTPRWEELGETVEWTEEAGARG